MAQIKIYSDTQKGCIFFDNSTVEPKFLGTIVAEIKEDETDRIHVFRTDRRRNDGVRFRTIFRRLNPSRVQNQDGQDLVGTLGYTVAEVVDYINEQASNQTGMRAPTWTTTPTSRWTPLAPASWLTTARALVNTIKVSSVTTDSPTSFPLTSPATP